jgi:dihydrofolate reductase
MRRVRYGVGISLDAFIADPQGGTGYLVSDPDYDQNAFFENIDTVLMGRKTFELAGKSAYPGLRTYVFSNTLPPDGFPGATIVSSRDAASTVAALRAEEGKDIWLAGGGELFASLAEAGVVDTVEVGLCPILIGQGVPITAPLPRVVRLELTEHKVYSRSGMVVLIYNVRRGEG